MFSFISYLISKLLQPVCDCGDNREGKPLFGGCIARNSTSFRVQDIQSLLETAVQNIIAEKWSYYAGCPRRNVRDFGRVFLMLNYTDITQNTYVQS
jgi:hypothetical protein